MRYLFSLTIGLAAGTVTYGQDTLQQATIAINAGVNHISNKDEFQSPYSYRGTNLMFGAAYAHTSANSQQMADVGYATGKIRSIVSPEADNHLVTLKYNHLFRIRPGNLPEKLDIYAGAGLYAFLSNTNYLPDIAGTKSYLSASANVMLNGKAVYKYNSKASLLLQAGLSAVGVVHRPDFEIYGDKLTKVAMIGENNLILLKLRYDYRLNSRMSCFVSYDYSYFSYNGPRRITLLQNGLLFGLQCHIR